MIEKYLNIELNIESEIYNLTDLIIGLGINVDDRWIYENTHIEKSDHKWVRVLKVSTEIDIIESYLELLPAGPGLDNLRYGLVKSLSLLYKT